MLAQRLPGILPPLTFDEALETTKIHSVAGLLGGDRQGAGRRAPVPEPAHHHLRRGADRRRLQSAPGRGLAGAPRRALPGRAGRVPPQRAGSAPPAARGRRVTLSRAAVSLTYPSRFMLVAAMNPCPCGHHGDGQRRARARRRRCSATWGACRGRCWTASTCTWRCRGALPRPRRPARGRAQRRDPRAGAARARGAARSLRRPRGHARQRAHDPARPARALRHRRGSDALLRTAITRLGASAPAPTTACSRSPAPSPTSTAAATSPPPT
jgi:hypothetical protein